MRDVIKRRSKAPVLLACALAAVASSALAAAPGPGIEGPAGEDDRGAVHKVSAGETVFGIAKRYGISVSRLIAINRLLTPYDLAVGLELRLPPEAKDSKGADAATIFRTHVVAPGETVRAIAGRYGVSVEDVARANRLEAPYAVAAGRVLAVPTSLTEATGATEREQPAPRPLTHVVRHGDTPYNIAQRYGITVRDLERANNLVSPYSIYLGSVLNLPSTASGGAPKLMAEPSSRLRVHTVRAGDTLYSISRLYGRSADAIRRQNHLEPPYTLTIGTLLVIPAEPGVPPPAPPTPPEAPQPPPVSEAPPPPQPGETAEAKIPRAGPLASAEFNLVAAVRGAFNYNTGQLQLADVHLEPYTSISLVDGWTFNARARFVADAVDKLERGRPDQSTRAKINRRLLIGDRAELELREAYLHGKAADIDWTIGKQAIVWGEADGLKVLDVVNPQSYKEFILAPYDKSRIPRWSVRAEKRFDDTTVEGVVLFDNTYNEYPTRGSSYDVVSARLRPFAALFPQVSSAPAEALFATFSPLVPFQFPDLPDTLPPITVEPPRRSGAAREPDFGTRVKTFFHGWDLSALYYRHTDLDPSILTRLTLSGIELTPVYDRVNLFGGSFANAFGDFTVRGEIGYTTGRVVATLPDLSRFAALAVASPDELAAFVASGPSLDTRVKRDDLSFVVGVDYFGLRNTVVSVQFFQQSVLDPPPNLLLPKTSYSGTFYIRRTALNEKLTADFHAIINFTEGDALLRPRIKYDFRDNLSGYVAADVFVGKSSGIFGSFRDSSRVLTGIEFNM